MKEVYVRKQEFDDLISNSNKIIATCPCCGYPTLGERGLNEICFICNWEDDGVNDLDYIGGPNGTISLRQAINKFEGALRELANDLDSKINYNYSNLIEFLDEERVDTIKFDYSILLSDSDFDTSKKSSAIKKMKEKL